MIDPLRWTCVYLRELEDGSTLYILLYVDDLIIVGSNTEAIDDLVAKLQSEYKIRDLGDLQYFIGVEIQRDRANKRIWLTQTKYIKDKLAEFKMTNCNSCVQKHLQRKQKWQINHSQQLLVVSITLNKAGFFRISVKNWKHIARLSDNHLPYHMSCFFVSLHHTSGVSGLDNAAGMHFGNTETRCYRCRRGPPHHCLDSFDDGVESIVESLL